MKFDLLPLLRIGEAAFLCELGAVKMQNLDRLLVQMPLAVLAMVEQLRHVGSVGRDQRG